MSINLMIFKLIAQSKFKVYIIINCPYIHPKKYVATIS